MHYEQNKVDQRRKRGFSLTSFVYQINFQLSFEVELQFLSGLKPFNVEGLPRFVRVWLVLA